MPIYAYIFDPLKPHFYIVKLGFTGVYIIFLIFAQKDGGYSLDPPRRYMENIRVFYLKILVFGGKIFYIFE